MPSRRRSLRQLATKRTIATLLARSVAVLLELLKTTFAALRKVSRSPAMLDT